MNISDSDIAKIKMITVSAQVNDLVTLLSNIDKESLLIAIDSVKPDNRNSLTYKFLVRALEFYEKIDELHAQRESENPGEQFDFNFEGKNKDNA